MDGATDKLYYYSVYDGELREARVIKETDKTFVVEETADFATRISKNGRPGSYMRNGNSLFFTDKAAAIEQLKDLCRLRIMELSRWQERLKELERSQ